jgi:hypothetical protein
MNSPAESGSIRYSPPTTNFPFRLTKLTKTPPTPSIASTSPRLIRTILLRYYDLTVSRFGATIPHVRPFPADLVTAGQRSTLAWPSPSSSPVVRTPCSPVCQCFSCSLRCSLTEQKESKPRASNPFALKRIKRPFQQLLFDSYACKLRGGVFFSAFISPSAFAGPSFRCRAHFRYNLSALAPAGLPMPCGCSSRTGFEVSG